MFYILRFAYSLLIIVILYVIIMTFHILTSIFVHILRFFSIRDIFL